MNSKDANSAIWSQRYEVLREHALNADVLADARPLGRIVVVRHGLAEWMRRWRESLDPAQASSSPGIDRPASLPTPDWQSQLTVVLAQMAVAHLQPCYQA